MSTRIFNFIQIGTGVRPVKSALTLTEEWLTHNPEQWVLDSHCYNDGDFIFTTGNWDTGCFIAKYISSQCKNVDVYLHRDGGYFDLYYIEDTYYNGSLMTHKFYDICNCKIQTPPCLGYEDNVYETFSFIPERVGADRDDILAVATAVLEHAIKDAPDIAGGLLLQDTTCEAFKTALKTAVDSLVKYHDFDSYSHPDSQEANDSGASSSNTTALVIGCNTEEEEFPF